MTLEIAYILDLDPDFTCAEKIGLAPTDPGYEDAVMAACNGCRKGDCRVFGTLDMTFGDGELLDLAVESGFADEAIYEAVGPDQYYAAINTEIFAHKSGEV